MAHPTQFSLTKKCASTHWNSGDKKTTSRRSRAQSQNSLNMLFKDTTLGSSESPVKQANPWSLKRIFNIVERQSMAIQTSREHKHNINNSKVNENDSQQLKTSRTARGNRNSVDEKSRERLSRFLVNQELIAAIQGKSITKVAHHFYDDDVEKEAAVAQIQKIKNQQIRYQYRHQKVESISNNYHITGKGWLTGREMQESRITPKQNTFNSVYLKIQQLTNEQRRKKIPITQHQLLTYRAKGYRTKPLVRKRLKRILAQVLFVAKYMVSHRHWFNYPIDHSVQFYQLLVMGNMNKITENLSVDPQLIHSRNHNGQTPLHIAAICNNVNVAQLLIRMNSHIEALDAKSLSPLYYAYKSNSPEVFKLLLQNSARPWSPPNGKLDRTLMSLVMQSLLMHARLGDLIFQHIQQCKCKSQDKELLYDYAWWAFNEYQLETGLYQMNQYGQTVQYFMISGGLQIPRQPNEPVGIVLVQFRFNESATDNIVVKVLNPNVNAIRFHQQYSKDQQQDYFYFQYDKSLKFKNLVLFIVATFTNLYPYVIAPNRQGSQNSIGSPNSQLPPLIAENIRIISADLKSNINNERTNIQSNLAFKIQIDATQIRLEQLRAQALESAHKLQQIIASLDKCIIANQNTIVTANTASDLIIGDELPTQMLNLSAQANTCRDVQRFIQLNFLSGKIDYETMQANSKKYSEMEFDALILIKKCQKVE